jgi:hypothetical protein
MGAPELGDDARVEPRNQELEVIDAGGSQGVLAVGESQGGEQADEGDRGLSEHDSVHSTRRAGG